MESSAYPCKSIVDKVKRDKPFISLLSDLQEKCYKLNNELWSISDYKRVSPEPFRPLADDIQKLSFEINPLANSITELLNVQEYSYLDDSYNGLYEKKLAQYNRLNQRVNQIHRDMLNKIHFELKQRLDSQKNKMAPYDTPILRQQISGLSGSWDNFNKSVQQLLQEERQKLEESQAFVFTPVDWQALNDDIWALQDSIAELELKRSEAERREKEQQKPLQQKSMESSVKPNSSVASPFGSARSNLSSVASNTSLPQQRSKWPPETIGEFIGHFSLRKDYWKKEKIQAYLCRYSELLDSRLFRAGMVRLNSSAKISPQILDNCYSILAKCYVDRYVTYNSEYNFEETKLKCLDEVIRIYNDVTEETYSSIKSGGSRFNSLGEAKREAIEKIHFHIVMQCKSTLFDDYRSDDLQCCLLFLGVVSPALAKHRNSLHLPGTMTTSLTNFRVRINSSTVLAETTRKLFLEKIGGSRSDTI